MPPLARNHWCGSCQVFWTDFTSFESQEYSQRTNRWCIPRMNVVITGWVTQERSVTFRERVFSHFIVCHSRWGGHLNNSLQNKENELQEDFPLLEPRKVTQEFPTKSSHLHFLSILVSAYPSPVLTVLLSLWSFAYKDVCILHHNTSSWNLGFNLHCFISLSGFSLLHSFSGLGL